MLMSLGPILQKAEERNAAIAAFNTPNLESLSAVLSVAEEYQTPLIISHAQVHEDVSPLSVIGPIMVLLARDATVPVCVHLDHGTSVEYIQRALDIGFTSVMYDGSVLPFEENVGNTCKVIAMARNYHADVEAEIGHVSGAESGEGAMYTDPQTAKEFVDQTGVDALAASFGTAHGFYAAKPKLDFERIEKIHDLTKVPLVMHGGSGVSPEDYLTAISKGVRKINYYSYMARAGAEAAKDYLKADSSNYYFHDAALTAEKAMRENAEAAVKIFYGLG